MNNIEAFDYKNWKEECWNAITHGIGFLFSIPACVMLIQMFRIKADSIDTPVSSPSLAHSVAS